MPTNNLISHCCKILFLLNFSYCYAAVEPVYHFENHYKLVEGDCYNGDVANGMESNINIVAQKCDAATNCNGFNYEPNIKAYSFWTTIKCKPEKVNISDTDNKLNLINSYYKNNGDNILDFYYKGSKLTEQSGDCLGGELNLNDQPESDETHKKILLETCATYCKLQSNCVSFSYNNYDKNLKTSRCLLKSYSDCKINNTDNGYQIYILKNQTGKTGTIMPDNSPIQTIQLPLL
jgi:hypothetical protein